MEGGPPSPSKRARPVSSDSNGSNSSGNSSDSSSSGRNMGDAAPSSQQHDGASQQQPDPPAFQNPFQRALHLSRNLSGGPAKNDGIQKTFASFSSFMERGLDSLEQLAVATAPTDSIAEQHRQNFSATKDKLRSKITSVESGTLKMAEDVEKSISTTKNEVKQSWKGWMDENAFLGGSAATQGLFKVLLDAPMIFKPIEGYDGRRIGMFEQKKATEILVALQKEFLRGEALSAQPGCFEGVSSGPESGASRPPPDFHGLHRTMLLCDVFQRGTLFSDFSMAKGRFLTVKERFEKLLESEVPRVTRDGEAPSDEDNESLFTRTINNLFPDSGPLPTGGGSSSADDGAHRRAAFLPHDLGTVLPRFTVVRAQFSSETYRPAHCILLDREQEAVIFVIRGTSEGADVLTDLVAKAVEVEVPNSSCGNAIVHEGMWEAAKNLAKENEDLVEQLLANNSNVFDVTEFNAEGRMWHDGGGENEAAEVAVGTGGDPNGGGALEGVVLGTGGDPNGQV